MIVRRPRTRQGDARDEGEGGVEGMPAFQQKSLPPSRVQAAPTTRTARDRHTERRPPSPFNLNP